ncbi:hypothetical protein G6F57_020945 [Rhizopus arrhizus]|nr:hypothetical protein G6F57_020945 [Rhizopus arrhizus]
MARHRQAASRHGQAQRAGAIGPQRGNHFGQRAAAGVDPAGFPGRLGHELGAGGIHAGRVETGAGAGAHGTVGARHGLHFHFMIVHHDDGALRLLADHVTGAQGAHGALGGLHQERAARIGGDGYGHGAIQQADLAVGGREIQINAAAG